MRGGRQLDSIKTGALGVDLIGAVVPSGEVPEFLCKVVWKIGEHVPTGRGIRVEIGDIGQPVLLRHGTLQVIHSVGGDGVVVRGIVAPCRRVELFQLVRIARELEKPVVETICRI